MSRESKFFLATIVLPALLMLAGGAALLHTVHRQMRVDFLCACLLFMMPILLMLVNGYVFFAKFRRERREGRRQAEFVDNVSHELRTPLAGIHLTAELLADGKVQGVDSCKKAARAILAEADRLNRTISALRDYSRLEKGSRQFQMEDFDLCDFTAGISADSAVVSCAGNRLRPIRTVSSEAVRAEKDAVFHIVLNLLENAVKYSADEVEIEVEGRELRVLDRGDGVAKGDEERVFERFYRGDSSLVRRFGGTGLGLSIARALARGMGGDLFYSRRQGGGSVFTLRLAACVSDESKT